MAGDQVQLAAGVGIGDAAPEDLDRQQDGGEGVVQFVDGFAQIEAEGVQGGGGGKQGHGSTQGAASGPPVQAARLP
ncbi:MAG TPA: hypothetical protein VFE31_14680 [Opitutaceae bacterium]|jgi:hypothetical protein|nr:hypothetical protein [Opitutaceae bacterium]